MFVIGITGGIGTGKSTVAGLLKEAGLPVIDADAISRKLTGSGGASLPRIREVFGNEFFSPNGELLRHQLADFVFAHRKSLDELNRIIHQDVVQEMGKTLQELKDSKVQACVLDVPLPVKVGFLDRCDQVWCVVSPMEIRLQRLAQRGLSREEALRRIQVQMDEEGYRSISTAVIDNGGSLEDLRKQCASLLEQELGARGIPYLPLSTSAD